MEKILSSNRGASTVARATAAKRFDAAAQPVAEAFATPDSEPPTTAAELSALRDRYIEFMAFDHRRRPAVSAILISIYRVVVFVAALVILLARLRG